jgi:hypothetical protein
MDGNEGVLFDPFALQESVKKGATVLAARQSQRNAIPICQQLMLAVTLVDLFEQVEQLRRGRMARSETRQ